MTVHEVGLATTEGVSLLQAVGVTPFQETVYELLLQSPRCSEKDVARRLGGAERTAVAEALDALENLGLVSRLPDGTVVIAPPGLAIEALALRRQREIDQARAGASRFVALHSARKERRADASELVELIRGKQAIQQHYMQLELSAKHRMRVFELPPYLANPPIREQSEAEFEILERGVECQGLYDASVLEQPGKIEQIEACVAAGEQARISPNLPAKLAIFDDEVAVLAMAEPGQTASDVVVLVHRSTLLTALIALFEAYWHRATPFTTGNASHPEEVNGWRLPRHARTLLSLVLAGMTNEAIARQLRVTPRTIHRRVEELCEHLGASNRYQLLLRARELGLV